MSTVLVGPSLGCLGSERAWPQAPGSYAPTTSQLFSVVFSLDVTCVCRLHWSVRRRGSWSLVVIRVWTEKGLHTIEVLRNTELPFARGRGLVWPGRELVSALYPRYPSA